MASTFLVLTNKLLRRFNEPVLTSSTFPNATGVHLVAQDFINDGIRWINLEDYEWPFNYTSGSQTLTADDYDYDLPAATKVVDWDTFFLREAEPTSAVKARAISQLPYDEYVRLGYREQNANTATGDGGIPVMISPGQNENFLVYPVPDLAYKIDFEYWAVPTDLSAHGDTTVIPTRFDPVIVLGASYYLHLFRGDVESAREVEKRFTDAVGRMRGQLVNTTRLYRVHDTRTGGTLRSHFFYGG